MQHVADDFGLKVSVGLGKSILNEKVDEDDLGRRSLAELKARGLIYVCSNYACLGFTIFVLGLTLCKFKFD